MPFPYKIIDLTHPLRKDMPTWNAGGCGYSTKTVLDYEDRPNDPVQFRVQQLKIHAGVGTHMDAPSHAVPHGLCIADLDVTSFFTDLIIIDLQQQFESFIPTDTTNISSHTSSYIDQIQPEHIEAFEQNHTPIPKKSLVLFYTGWYKYWDSPDSYRNQYIFPTLSSKACDILINRDVCGIGIDTFSPDSLSEEFPVHQKFLSMGKFIIENIAYVEGIPSHGSYVGAVPLKAMHATECPIRLFAMIPK